MRYCACDLQKKDDPITQIREFRIKERTLPYQKIGKQTYILRTNLNRRCKIFLYHDVFVNNCPALTSVGFL